MTHGPVYKWPLSFSSKLNSRNIVIQILFLSTTVILILGFGFVSYWTRIHPPSTAAPTQKSQSVDLHKTFIKNEFIKAKETLFIKGIPAVDLLKKQVEHNQVERGISASDGWNTSPVKEHLTADKHEYSSTFSRTEISWDDPKLDILHMPKPEFNARFKNPCWYEPLPGSDPYKGNKYILYSPSAKDTLADLTDKWEELYENEVDPKRLRCLPYFLIIGQPKCGSTDLFWKVAKHPDIGTPPIKELHWWSRNRQGRRFSYSKIIPFEDYVDMFDKVALRIEERAVNLGLQHPQDSEFSSQIITGEASVSVLWDNNDWMKFPENRNKREPVYVNPHYVHHIIPDVKLIVILREPVERMYSDYLYFHATNKSADDFHQAVKNAVNCYKRCMEKHSIRYCVHNMNVTNRARIRLRVGLYSVFLKDWFSVFPRQQFFILRLEDYSGDPLKYIEQIYKFLDVRDLTLEEEHLILDSPISNVRKAEHRELGGMHSATRTLLRDFYRPFNIELAKMLQDNRYLWLDEQ